MVQTFSSIILSSVKNNQLSAGKVKDAGPDAENGVLVLPLPEEDGCESELVREAGYYPCSTECLYVTPLSFYHFFFG